MILNLGGTISSTVKCGALAPSEGRDSSQFTKEYLDTCVDQILRSVAEERKVIVLTGTDTVGDFGDFLKTQIECEPCCIVLTAAMSPEHKKDAIKNAEKINTPGVHIVVTDMMGEAYIWDLNDVSILKNGEDLLLPFTMQKRSFACELARPPENSWIDTYNVVCPTITDTAEEIAQQIRVATRLNTENNKPILLFGYGFYNFPIQEDCIKAVLRPILKNDCVYLATRTRAYMQTDCSDMTPYLPMQWLVANGAKIVKTKS